MANLIRPLSIGEILDGAFGLYRRHFLLLVGPVAVLLIGTSLLGLVSPILSTVLLIPATIYSQALLVGMSSELIRGRSPGVGESLVESLKNLIPFALVWLAYTILTGIAFLMLFIPGLLAAVFFFAYQQTVVIEKRVNFVGRGFELVRGGFWKCAAVVLLTLIIAGLPGALLLVGALSSSEQLASLSSPGTFSLYNLAGVAVGALTHPFSALATTLLYYERRVSVEGLDVQESAEALERSIAGTD